MDLDKLLKNQKEFFKSGKTLSVEFRINMLKKLYSSVKNHEEEMERCV